MKHGYTCNHERTKSDPRPSEGRLLPAITYLPPKRAAHQGSPLSPRPLSLLPSERAGRRVGRGRGPRKGGLLSFAGAKYLRGFPCKVDRGGTNMFLGPSLGPSSTPTLHSGAPSTEGGPTHPESLCTPREEGFRVRS